MDYLNQLLESYSRLKKRKLILTERQHSPEAESEARAAMTQAKSAQTAATKPFFANTARGKVAIYTTSAGKTRFNTAHDGIKVTNTAVGKDIESQWSYFVGLFEKESEGENSGGQEQPQPQQGQAQGQQLGQPQQGIKPAITPGGATLTEGMLVAGIPVENIKESIEAFQRIQVKADGFLKKLSKSILIGIKNPRSAAELGIAKLRSYIYGGRESSLERQLATALVVKVDKDGKLSKVVSEPDPFLTNEISETLETIIELGSKDNLTESEKLKLLGSMAVANDGSVILFADQVIQSRGMAFTDYTNFLKGVMTSFKEKFGLDFKKVDIKDIAGNLNVESIRGQLMEVIPSLIVSMKNVPPEQRKKYTEDTLVKIAKNFSQKLEAMGELLARRASKIDYAANLQDYAALKELSESFEEILGDPAAKEKLISFLSDKFSKDIGIRNPNRILLKTKITGYGRKSDNLEIYDSVEHARKALIDSGLSNEEASVMIKEVSIEEAYEGNPTQYKLDKESGFLDGKNTLVTVTDSMKFSKNKNNPTKTGDLSENSLDVIFDSKATPSNVVEAIAKKRQIDMIKKVTGMDSQSVADCEEYHSTLRKKEQKRQKLVTTRKATAQSKDGKNTNISPNKEVVTAYADITRKHTSYEDQTSPGHTNTLVAECDNEKERSEKSEESPGDKDHAARTAKRLNIEVRNKEIMKDISSKDKNKSKTALNYMMSKVFACAGSSDDGLMVHTVYGDSDESSMYQHNAPLKEAFDDLRNGGENWGVELNGNTWTIYNKQNKKIKMTASEAIRTCKSCPDGYIAELSTDNSSELVNHYSRRGNKVKEHTSLITQYLQNQQLIINELVKLSSTTNVIHSPS
tara:strand:- start:12515 stop:15094 length:2580 start_codon:yes stop_codon:yes gene_type:complete